jgi:hypothetical protein
LILWQQVVAVEAVDEAAVVEVVQQEGSHVKQR